MATTFWTGNGENVAQADTLTIAGTPAAGNTISGVINGKSVTYTLISGDTASTAAAGLQALLASSNAPPEFQEITWSVTNAVITGTAASPGTPFTLTAAATGGGATCTHAAVTANVGQNDVNNAANWLRSGSQSLPQAGDDVILADSNVSLLYNLSALSAITINSFTRYNTFTGQVGLPENNPNGYYEYRTPTYLQLDNSSIKVVTLGLGPGGGCAFERYDGQSVPWTWLLLPGASGARIINTSATSTFTVNGAQLDIATLPAEVSTCTGGVTVVNGGIVSIGVGVTFAGTLTVQSASVAFLNCAPTTITCNGGTVTMNATGGTVTTLTAQNSSQVFWLSSTTITTLSLLTNSTFDKSGDNRAMTITNSTIDNTSQVIDPWSTITWTNATNVTGAVTTGIITFGPGKTIKVV